MAAYKQREEVSVKTEQEMMVAEGRVVAVDRVKKGTHFENVTHYLLWIVCGVERKRGCKNDFMILGLSDWKDGVAI